VTIRVNLRPYMTLMILRGGAAQADGIAGAIGRAAGLHAACGHSRAARARTGAATRRAAHRSRVYSRRTPRVCSFAGTRSKTALMRSMPPACPIPASRRPHAHAAVLQSRSWPAAGDPDQRAQHRRSDLQLTCPWARVLPHGARPGCAAAPTRASSAAAGASGGSSCARQCRVATGRHARYTPVSGACRGRPWPAHAAATGHIWQSMRCSQESGATSRARTALPHLQAEQQQRDDAVRQQSLQPLLRLRLEHAAAAPEQRARQQRALNALHSRVARARLDAGAAYGATCGRESRRAFVRARPPGGGAMQRARCFLRRRARTAASAQAPLQHAGQEVAAGSAAEGLQVNGRLLQVAG